MSHADQVQSSPITWTAFICNTEQMQMFTWDNSRSRVDITFVYFPRPAGAAAEAVHKTRKHPKLGAFILVSKQTTKFHIFSDLHKMHLH